MTITEADMERAGEAALQAFVTALYPSASADAAKAIAAIVALTKAAQAKETTAELFGLLLSDLPVIVALVSDIEASQPAPVAPAEPVS